MAAPLRGGATRTFLFLLARRRFGGEETAARRMRKRRPHAGSWCLRLALAPLLVLAGAVATAVKTALHVVLDVGFQFLHSMTLTFSIIRLSIILLENSTSNHP